MRQRRTNNIVTELDIKKPSSSNLTAVNDHQVIDIDVDNVREEKDDEMSIECIYCYAKYLFMKYIDVDSDFTINVSHIPRQNLLLFFGKKMENGFEFILNKKGVMTPVLLKEAEQNEQYVCIIKSWLYHMFDNALIEVWNLLSSDTFVRFMQGEEYHYLVNESLKKNGKQ